MANKTGRGVDMEDFLHAINYAAKHSERGMGGIADSVGYAEQTLRNKLNPNDDSHRPLLSDFITVLKLSDDVTPLEVLCNMFGGRFMSRSQQTASSLMHAVLEMVGEQGDLTRAIEESLAGDGVVDDAERARINREADQVIAAVTRIKNTANKQ